ncbi:GIY-YIG nuclease family protein [bacterium]|nr:GIY-YIG nuclease family protein [bacterium]
MNWIVYIIMCSDNTLYTGISNDIEKRFKDHQNGNGAKYFRGRKPEELVYVEEGHSRSTASKRELEIKKMTRTKKDQLIKSSNEELKVG